MATLNEWIAGARPRTLAAAVAPVVIGTGSAYAMGSGRAGHALLALIVAAALQVGVNYANDYSDGVRGTDEDRVGPVRLVGQGLADPGEVKAAAFLSFGVAALFGLLLITLSGAWLFLLVGLAAIWAAWAYTGGERPYGYMGLGEVFVFIFFGLVAVLGTTWTQAHRLDLASWAGAVGAGALACAILVVNNLRDIDGDALVGKHTLAVRLGAPRTRQLYVALLALAMVCAIVAGLEHRWALLALVALPLAVAPARAVLRRARGRALIAVLGQTAAVQLAYGIALGLGLYLTSRLA